MKLRVPRVCLLGIAMCHGAIAAYLPILGARSVRFQAVVSAPPTTVALPPLPLHDNDPSVEGSLPNSNRPTSDAMQVETLGPVTEPGILAGEEDPMAAGLPPELNGGELLGPREPSEPPQIAPQVFLRFFDQKGTNRPGIITLPTTFTPPVAAPPNNQSSATLEIR